VAFTDKIWHDVDFTDCGIAKEEERVAEARFFFPEAAGDIGENAAGADCRRVHERRCARGRIYGRAVTDNEKRARFGRHEENVERPTPNVQHRIRKIEDAAGSEVERWLLNVGCWTLISFRCAFAPTKTPTCASARSAS